MAKKGRKLSFETPEEILNEFLEYSKEVKDHPDVQQVATAKGVVEVELKRPLTIKGFYSFIFNKHGVLIHHYFENTDNRYSQFRGVVTHIRATIEDDHVSGSLTGRYKSPNLVARLHGYGDKNQVNLTTEQPLFPDKNDK